MALLPQAGDSYVTEDCSKTCKCEKAGGELECTDSPCNKLETCTVQNGVRDCYCLAPAVFLDGACRGIKKLIELKRYRPGI